MEWVLLSLLVGHFAGDFALQPRSLVKRKYDTSALLEHGVLLYTAHLLAFFPYLTAKGGLLLLAVVATHMAIDWTKLWLKTVMDAPKSLFVADQALHILTCIVAWLAYDESGAKWAPTYVVVTGIVTIVAGYIVWKPFSPMNRRQG